MTNETLTSFDDPAFELRVVELLERRGGEIDIDPLGSKVAGATSLPARHRARYLVACATVSVVVAATFSQLFFQQSQTERVDPTPISTPVADGPNPPAIDDSGPSDAPPSAEDNNEPEPTESTPVPEQPAPAGEGSPSEAFQGVSEEKLRTVRGIRIHVSLAAGLEQLLAEAERDGIILSGVGYRDPQSQIEVRRLNCGPTEYDIYQKPAGECMPPTARPGTSSHERALAVDFITKDNATIKRDSPEHVWLVANAPKYGFIGMPDEPWHWSVDGT